MGKTIRRVLLGLLVVLGVIFVSGGPPQVCQDAVTENAAIQSGKVELCGPVGLTDLRVALFAFAAALLLIGELSELEIAGVVSLKARVAEARAEAAEVRAEVARLRASADARSTATAVTNVYTHGRPADTAEALDRAERGELSITGADVQPLTARVDPGVAAAAAFSVAFAGLRTLLPSWTADAAVIGYTLTAEGTFARHADSRAEQAEIDACAALLDEDGATSWLDVSPERWLAAVSVGDDTGAPMGAIAVVLRTPPGPGEVADERRAHEDLETAVEVLGTIYARLLIDLLGERAPIAGQNTTGGAQ